MCGERLPGAWPRWLTSAANPDRPTPKPYAPFSFSGSRHDLDLVFRLIVDASLNETRNGRHTNASSFKIGSCPVRLDH
jgi:hypothetical protein